MSKQTVTHYTCDRCKAVDKPGTVTFAVQTGWTRDVASGRSDADDRDVELCPGCLRLAVVWFMRRDPTFRDDSFSTNEAFLKEFAK